MFTIRKPALAISAFIFLLIGGLAVVLAQNGACPALIDQVVHALDKECADLPRNNACYGYQQVKASFSQQVPAGFFTQPGDRTALNTLTRLETSPLDVTTQQLGAAVLKVQANLPNTLPGQAITMVLMGSAQVENAVSAQDAVLPPDPITVRTAAAADLHAEPNDTSPIVASVPAGTDLPGDATSPDGLWVRVTYQERVAWVLLVSLNDSDALNRLLVLTDHTRSPMQAFYFRTGIGAADCQQTPNSVLIQGPGNVTVDFSANGADFRLGGSPPSGNQSADALPFTDMTAMRPLLVGFPARTLPRRRPAAANPPATTLVLQTASDGQTAKISVLSGNVQLYPDQPQEVKVNAGDTSSFCLSQPSNLGTDGQSNDQAAIPGCGEAPRPMTDEEQQGVQAFAQLSADIVNQPVTVPTPEVTPEPTTVTPAVACQPNADWTATYVVQPGDTLGAIARLLNIPVETLAEGNCIVDVSRVDAGQTLRVPQPVPTATPASTATPAAINLHIVNGSPQSARIGTTFGTSFQVRVDDAGGAPLPGITITFSAPTTGASGTFPNGASSVSLVTDANGTVVAPPFTANRIAGGYIVLATCAGCVGINFWLTNLAPPTATPTKTPTATATATYTASPTDTPTLTPTPLPAPVQLSPPDGSVFSVFPRTTTVTWSPVAGAVSYTVDVEYFDPLNSTWNPQLTHSGITGTSFTFNFVGAQPGRWRVAAVDAAGQTGAFSGWWGFTYTV